MLFWLSIGLLVSIFFIIRGSSWPLIINTKLFKDLLLVDRNADHTIYNIAISYVAAYIFYLIQVYFPERNKTQIALLQTHLSVWNFVRQGSYFLDGWLAYTKRTKDGAIIGVDLRTIYFEDDEKHIFELTPEKWIETGNSATEEYNKLKNNRELAGADLALQNLLLEFDFDKEFDQEIQSLEERLQSAIVLDQQIKRTIAESYDPAEIAIFKLKLNMLAVVYNIPEAASIREIKDQNKINKYKKDMEMGLKIIDENKDYFQTMNSIKNE